MRSRPEDDVEVGETRRVERLSDHEPVLEQGLGLGRGGDLLRRRRDEDDLLRPEPELQTTLPLAGAEVEPVRAGEVEALEPRKARGLPRESLVPSEDVPEEEVRLRAPERHLGGRDCLGPP